MRNKLTRNERSILAEAARIKRRLNENYEIDPKALGWDLDDLDDETAIEYAEMEFLNELWDFGSRKQEPEFLTQDAGRSRALQYILNRIVEIEKKYAFEKWGGDY
jgi:hypothetical protein